MPDQDDEESTPPVVRIGNAANLELLRIVGNLLLEQKQHVRVLSGLYKDLRGLVEPAPASWAPRLHEELQRHHAEEGTGIGLLAALVQK
jgi:hypothetical protein